MKSLFMIWGWLAMKWLKQLLCGHFMSDELRSDKSRPYIKRHYHYCKKCGKKQYVD